MSIAGIVELLLAQSDELMLRLGEHIMLTFASLFISVLIGVGLALIAFYFKSIRVPLMAMVNMIQTIPSLAMLALLFAVFQTIGPTLVIISLVLYALLPIARGTLTGLENVSPDLIEAARGIGMTKWQRLSRIRLPLALPNIISAIRVATNISIGIATIATFIGGGALGVFISRGLSKSEPDLILLGAIPAALLALLMDALIANIQRVFFGDTEHPRVIRQSSMLRPAIALIMPLMVLIAGLWMMQPKEQVNGGQTIRIGSKNFSEQLILGEMVAQLIEAKTNLNVERLFGMQGTLILHEALLSAEIDIYPEYTGTAAANIVKKDLGRDPWRVYEKVRNYYAAEYDLTALMPLGFNNTYVFNMKPEVADKYDISTLSDVIDKAPELKAAFDFEFAERDDGYKGLKEKYNLRFADVTDIHVHLMYEALQKDEVDIISGYATDGRIAAYGLRSIQDNLQFFPPYDVFLVVRSPLLVRYPKLKNALNMLSGKLSNEQMQQLNYAVDAGKRDPAHVAREWLERQGLLR